MIRYGQQLITEEDIQEVIKVLNSEFLTQGPTVSEFERNICSYTGAQFGVATSNATAALHCAYFALGLKKGDKVWTSPNTFVATANAALYCGAHIDFVDIDLATNNICVDTLEEKLRSCESAAALPKIVVPVHMAGRSCDMAKIYALSQEFGFSIVEDASHAIGGKYGDQHIGSCAFSDITVFSFHPVKIITSGEGGMALTNNAALARTMALYRSHGITRDQSEMTKASKGQWYYEQLMLGHNYRLTDLAAALGSSQAKKIDQFVEQRYEIAVKYNKQLLNLPLTLPALPDTGRSSFHLYIVRCPENSSERDKLFEFLSTNGIEVNVHYMPVHLQPYYRNLGFSEGDFPFAEVYGETAISLPIHPSLSEQDTSYIIEMIKNYFNE